MEDVASSPSPPASSEGGIAPLPQVSNASKFLLDLYKVHKNEGDVYTLWNVHGIPTEEDELKKLIASLEVSKTLKQKIVLDKQDMPTKGQPLKGVLVGAGITSTIVDTSSMKVVKAKEYSRYVLFQVESGASYCMRPIEAN